MKNPHTYENENVIQMQTSYKRKLHNLQKKTTYKWKWKLPLNGNENPIQMEMETSYKWKWEPHTNGNPIQMETPYKWKWVEMETPCWDHDKCS
jgi:hypothetical protein